TATPASLPTSSPGALLVVAPPPRSRPPAPPSANPLTTVALTVLGGGLRFARRNHEHPPVLHDSRGRRRRGCVRVDDPRGDSREPSRRPLRGQQAAHPCQRA